MTAQTQQLGGLRRLWAPRTGSFWGKVLFYFAIILFSVNLLAMVSTVLVDSFGKEWFGSWLPKVFTTEYYTFVSTDHDMTRLLTNTLLVALAVMLIGLLIAFPAAYVLARKSFRLKGLLMALYLLPMMVPPLVYGIPLATILLRLGLGSTVPGVIMINLVPIVPFMILILTPFIEQVDVSLEAASQMLGASRFHTFRRVVLPLVIPGLLSAGLLAIVRTIAMFELTFLVADANSQTLVVALFGDANAAGIRPPQAISAMAVIYMLTTMSLLIVALMFVKPTQFVVTIKNR